MSAVIPPVAPRSPVDGGAPPLFSAKLGAWRKPVVSGKTRLDGCGSPATKRPGNLTDWEVFRLRLAFLILNLLVWGAVLGVYTWVLTLFYRGLGS